MGQAKKYLILAICTLFLVAARNPLTVSTQAGSPYDLIDAVNSLRQSQGLAPYSIDSYLMGFAQSHSDYMASLGTWTHTRADGSTAFDVGIKENVAMGTNMSVQYCIYTAWADWVHWQTMTAYAAGKVGAGVSVSDGIVYYTLNVLPEDSMIQAKEVEDEIKAAVAPDVMAQEDTPNVLAEVITSTPDADGIITHIVQYGETLWTIAMAYDVPINVILSNSGLSLTTTTVYAGQVLLIQTARDVTPTATPILTDTPVPDTPTPTLPRPTLTPFPTRTPAPTFTPTPSPSFLHRALGDRMNVGIGLIAICGLGLLILIYLGFIKKS